MKASDQKSADRITKVCLMLNDWGLGRSERSFCPQDILLVSEFLVCGRNSGWLWLGSTRQEMIRTCACNEGELLDNLPRLFSPIFSILIAISPLSGPAWDRLRARVLFGMQVQALPNLSELWVINTSLGRSQNELWSMGGKYHSLLSCIPSISARLLPFPLNHRLAHLSLDY